MAFSCQQVGLLGDGVDALGHLRDLGQRFLQAGQLPLDDRNRLDEGVDVVDRVAHRLLGRAHTAGGLGRLLTRVTGGRDDAPVALVDLAGGVDQLPERLGLLRDSGGDFVDVARDVDDLDAEAGGFARQSLDNSRFRGHVTHFQP